jgi:glycosyltransferase involved in cell wall biosynthesis
MINSPNQRPIIHIWSSSFTNIEGGIQEFTRFVVRAVQESFPEYEVKVVEYGVFSTKETTLFWILRKFQGVIFSLGLLLRVFRERPKVIISTHLHFAPVCWLADCLWGIPSIVVSHGVEAWGKFSPWKARILRGIRLHLAVSRFTRDRLVEAAGVAVRNVAVFPNTFDENRFIPAAKSLELLQQLGIKPDRKIILTVGRLAITEQYKGYDQIIRLLPRLAQMIPNIHYLLVGSGNDQERVKQLIVDSGVQDKVTLAGFVPREQLPAYYQLCDLYAMPSTGEGFGIAFLEAMACGRPCLGGSLDGSRDPLMDGKLGTLVDPRQLEDVAAGIIKALDGTDERDHTPKLEQIVRTEFGYHSFRERLAIRITSLIY